MKQDSAVYNPALGRFVPRVTTVLRVLDKFNLRYWYALEAAKHGIRAGMAISFDEDVSLEERAKSCVEKVDQYVADTADFGDEVHQWLRRFNSDDPAEPSELIAACVAPWPAWNKKHVLAIHYVEQQVYGEIDGLHYGGTLDFLPLLRAGTKLGHGGRVLEDNTWAWIDFKTGGQYYPDQGYQTAAYLNATPKGLDGELIRLTIRLDREKPGKVYLHEWTDYDNDLGMFRDCLSIWYRLNGHRLTDMVQSSSTQKEIACLASNSTPSTS